MTNPKPDLRLARMLAERLERISADSVWAHKASGVRGALLRVLGQSPDENPPDPKTLTNIVTIALNILAQAARHS